MKIYKKSLTIGLVFILIGLLFLSLSNNILGDETLEFTFENNIFYDKTNPTPNFGLNTRNQTVYTQTYNGIYSFTYDINGEVPIGWTILSEEDIIEVVSTYKGHDKLLHIDGAGWNELYQGFTSKTKGSIEYWMITDDSSLAHYITLKDTATTKVYFYVQNGYFAYSDGTPHNIVACSNNIWYHIRIDFECGFTGYKGLSPDTYFVYINGIQYGAYNFYEVSNNINQNAVAISGNIEVYFDAYGYSWETDYNINDNIIPYNYKNNTIEIDNWGFLNNEDGSTTGNLQSEIPNWEKQTIYAKISNEYITVDNMTVKIPSTSTTHYGIYRAFTIETGIIEIVFNFAQDVPGPEAVEYVSLFDIKSYDGTLIIRLKLEFFDNYNYKLYQYDGSSYNELQLFEDDLIFRFYNLTIVNNVVILTIDSTDIYMFPLIVLGKNGLSEVRFESFVTVGGEISYLVIDLVGVYINGLSLSNDFANYFYETNKDFNNKNHNLLYLNATGFFGFSMTSSKLSGDIFRYFDYQNVSEINFLDVIEYEEQSPENAYLTITTNTTYQINSILIEGIAMIEGINVYHPTFSSGNINISESYFWVDSSNRLQFKLIVNDTDLEYIQAVFNLNNVPSEDRSISFASNIDGESKGFFSLDYTDSKSSLFEFPYYETTTKVILPQTKTIKSFTILITDNDLNNNDLCTGYISNIYLHYNPDLEITILVSDMIKMIIPLIVMIIPSIIMGKKFGVVGTIITFILMSLICLIGNLIPIWLFFIITFGSITFLLMRKQIEGVK